jgi:hypothetical protein
MTYATPLLNTYSNLFIIAHTQSSDSSTANLSNNLLVRTESYYPIRNSTGRPSPTWDSIVVGCAVTHHTKTQLAILPVFSHNQVIGFLHRHPWSYPSTMIPHPAQVVEHAVSYHAHVRTRRTQ